MAQLRDIPPPLQNQDDTLNSDTTQGILSLGDYDDRLAFAGKYEKFPRAYLRERDWRMNSLSFVATLLLPIHMLKRSIRLRDDNLRSGIPLD